MMANARVWSRVIMESWKDVQTHGMRVNQWYDKRQLTQISFCYYLLFTQRKKHSYWHIIQVSSWSTGDTFTYETSMRTCHLPDHNCNSAASIMAARHYNRKEFWHTQRLYPVSTPRTRWTCPTSLHTLWNSKGLILSVECHGRQIVDFSLYQFNSIYKPKKTVFSDLCANTPRPHKFSAREFEYLCISIMYQDYIKKYMRRAILKELNWCRSLSSILKLHSCISRGQLEVPRHSCGDFNLQAMMHIESSWINWI